MRFLGHMDAHVLKQVTLVLLVAYLAFKRLIVRMVPHEVLLEAVAPYETLAALVTRVVALALMPFYVVQQVRLAYKIGTA